MICVLSKTIGSIPTQISIKNIAVLQRINQSRISRYCIILRILTRHSMFFQRRIIQDRASGTFLIIFITDSHPTIRIISIFYIIKTVILIGGCLIANHTINGMLLHLSKGGSIRKLSTSCIAHIIHRIIIQNSSMRQFAFLFFFTVGNHRTIIISTNACNIIRTFVRPLIISRVNIT